MLYPAPSYAILEPKMYNVRPICKCQVNRPLHGAFRPTCRKTSDTVTYLAENGQTGQDSRSSQLIIVVRILRSGAFNTLTKCCAKIDFFPTILSPKRIVLSGRSF